MKRQQPVVDLDGGSGVKRRSLPPDVRRSDVLAYLRQHEGAGLAELARVHRVSSVTIHRDLERLAGEGLVERVHGGARVPDEAQVMTAWTRRLAAAGDAKRAIAEAAADLVEPDWTIFVDSSTTCLAFAEALAKRPGLSLAIVTNSPAIAYTLDAPSIHIVLVPGELNQELRLVAGAWTTEFLAKLTFRMAFMSGSGITPDQGIGSMTRPLADVLQTVRSVSEHSIALIDSTKFGRPSLVKIGAPHEFDLIVVDDGLPTELRREYKRAGARLHLAPTTGASAGKQR